MSMFSRKEPNMSPAPAQGVPVTKIEDNLPAEVAQYAPKRLPELVGDPHDAISKSVEFYNKLRTDYATAKIALEAAQAEIMQRDNKIQFLEYQVQQLQHDIDVAQSARDEAMENETAWRVFFTNVNAVITQQDQQMTGFFNGLKALFDRYNLPEDTPPRKRKREKAAEPEKLPEVEAKPVVDTRELETELRELVLTDVAKNDEAKPSA
jgi:hypothetical protein